MQGTPKNGNRRGFLIGAALLASAYGGLRWWSRRLGPVEYEPLVNLPGFRRVEGGEVSVASWDPFVGLNAAAEPIEPIPLERLCDALFAAGTGPGVPVAFFTDYFCPYCRVMTGFLSERNENGIITLTTHETPLLGEDSKAAARAALAAGRQGAYEAFNRRLMRSVFSPGAPYLARLADSIGIDAERLLREMDGAMVSEQLALTRSLAVRFGFFATPSMVIGRTAVVGSIGETELDRLIKEEAADPGGVC
jgi:protein-disulfide isomerase